MINDKAWQGVRKLLLIQILITISVAGVWWLTQGNLAAKSAALGGLVHVLPSWLFAHKLFRYAGAQQAKQILKSLYLGEAIKLILTLVLFAMVFIYIKIDAVAFFLTFLLIQTVFWIAPLMIKTRD